MIDSAVLQVNNLSVRYEEGIALEDVNFSIQAGDCVAVIGPNGAGKSTLMRAIMELVPIQSGARIQVNRERLGYVPQHQAVDWSFPVTVNDVVMMGLVRQIGWFRWPRKQHWQQVSAALERVELAHLGSRQIGELSGGQRQRVFIARALAQQADILLLDEPFAGVDVAAQAGLMNVILDLNQNAGITILLTTHDLNLAFNRFEKVMAIHQRMIAFGSPQETYTAETLQALYGGAVATFSGADGSQTLFFVDDDSYCCSS